MTEEHGSCLIPLSGGDITPSGVRRLGVATLGCFKPFFLPLPILLFFVLEPDTEEEAMPRRRGSRPMSKKKTRT
jgi:hypothetical protein